GDGYVIGSHGRVPRARGQARRPTLRSDAIDEGVALVEDEVGLGIDVGGAGDLGIDAAIFDRDATFKDGAHDAFLTPRLAGLEFAVGVKARELGAGTGAARRTVVRLARTENEALAIGAGSGRRSEQLDVIDVAAMRAGDALALEALADAPGVIGEGFEAVESE